MCIPRRLTVWKTLIWVAVWAEVYNPVGGNGVYHPDTPVFAGQHIFKANDDIVAALDERKVLLVSRTFPAQLSALLAPQDADYFSRHTAMVRQHDGQRLALCRKSAVEDVQWIPDWGRARIDSMLAERPDWCISRQRTWGVPIALFVHNTTGEIHPDTQSLMEQVAVTDGEPGYRCWFDLDPAELLGDDAAHYEKVTDTLDVWFDSGVTHECVLRSVKA